MCECGYDPTPGSCGYGSVRLHRAARDNWSCCSCPVLAPPATGCLHLQGGPADTRVRQRYCARAAASSHMRPAQPFASPSRLQPNEWMLQMYLSNFARQQRRLLLQQRSPSAAMLAIALPPDLQSCLLPCLLAPVPADECLEALVRRDRTSRQVSRPACSLLWHPGPRALWVLATQTPTDLCSTCTSACGDAQGLRRWR